MFLTKWNLDDTVRETLRSADPNLQEIIMTQFKPKQYNPRDERMMSNKFTAFFNSVKARVENDKGKTQPKLPSRPLSQTAESRGRPRAEGQKRTVVRHSPDTVTDMVRWCKERQLSKKMLQKIEEQPKYVWEALLEWNPSIKDVYEEEVIEQRIEKIISTRDHSPSDSPSYEGSRSGVRQRTRSSRGNDGSPHDEDDARSRRSRSSRGDYVTRPPPRGSAVQGRRDPPKMGSALPPPPSRPQNAPRLGSFAVNSAKGRDQRSKGGGQGKSRRKTPWNTPGPIRPLSSHNQDNRKGRGRGSASRQDRSGNAGDRRKSEEKRSPSRSRRGDRRPQEEYEDDRDGYDDDRKGGRYQRRSRGFPIAKGLLAGAVLMNELTGAEATAWPTPNDARILGSDWRHDDCSGL